MPLAYWPMREVQRADVFVVAYRNYWWASVSGGLYFVVGYFLWDGSRAALLSSGVFLMAALAGLVLHYAGPVRRRQQRVALILASLIVGHVVLAWQKANLPLSDYTSIGDPAARDTLTYLVSSLFVGTMSMFAGKWGAVLGLTTHYVFFFEPGEGFSFKWVFPTLIAAAGIIVSSAFWRLDEAYDRLELQATRDHLTGLINRRGLATAFERLRTHAVEKGTGLLLIAWDLDDLKRTNDVRGHAAGDAYIREFATALRAAVRNETDARTGDAAFRIGGDEFLSLHVNAADGASIVARVRQRCSSVSAGWINCENLTLDQAMTSADAALYQDKLQRKQHTDDLV